MTLKHGNWHYNHEDGCKPTCSNIFAVKGADKEYNAMYTCDNKGNVFVTFLNNPSFFINLLKVMVT